MKRKYFSKFEEIKPLEVLSDFNDSQALLLIALGIYPQSGETDILEERRNWLHQFWVKAIEVSDEVGGCSLSWDQLFFVTYKENKLKITNRFQLILQSLQHKDFVSYCILGEAADSLNNQLDILDVMHHELASKKNFGNGNGQFVRFLNGNIYSATQIG